MLSIHNTQCAREWAIMAAWETSKYGTRKAGKLRSVADDRGNHAVTKNIPGGKVQGDTSL